jgi:hypothetical protein
MKLLFTSLGIFLLYLSCIPCGDSGECNVKAEVKISSTTGHEQHNHDEESCTPFCTCTCCAASVFNSTLFKTPAITVAPSSQKFLLLNVVFNAEAHYSIWEPPQLV